MRLIIDLDDTLLVYPDTYKLPHERGGKERYRYAKPCNLEIELCNRLYKKGHVIIIYTGRGWDQYILTKMQLKKFKIKYHELIMGKPYGIYIDRDNKRSLKDIENVY